MELNADQVRGLARHLGYGNPAAPLWFVGGEEGLGGKMSAREQAENLATRARWEPVMDLAAAHEGLQEAGGYIDDLVDRPGATITWRYMGRIARAFEGAPDWNDGAAAASYVRHQLGRTGGHTFLTEISPFPARRAKQPAELRDFADRALVERVLAERAGVQLELLRAHRPALVICYGTGRRTEFARRLGIEWRESRTVAWRSAKSGSLRRTTLFRGEGARLEQASTSVFLLPFLGNGALGAPVLREFVESAEFQRCRG